MGWPALSFMLFFNCFSLAPDHASVIVVCDQMFFSELMKEASEIAGFFSSRVRHLLHLHIATGMQRYMTCLHRCFKDDHQAMVQEGQMLIEYVTMNAIALRKILKKYDKVSMNASILLILFNVWVVKFFPEEKG